ncbi:glycoside hydrolase family 5 protein [Embleya sp. NBC_00896]|uniref:glycoside hydrolase family 5 protein n=1 Tax=Embleya sp. NBC_00896 TaxID=2975961 RepID=UPI00386F90A7|nr:glycoside hydrolase family 5 protein [Embleya sp. NBC_00896]
MTRQRFGPALIGSALTALVAALLVPTTAAQAESPGPNGAPATTDLATSWTPPLSTQGRWIVDANGDRFKLKSGSWHGASGTWSGSGDINDPANYHDNEISYELPMALDRVAIPTVLDNFRQLGLNSIRLQFSNEMIHKSTPVADAAVAANPQLRGKTPIQVYDAVVAALTDAGFAVIMNNHTTTSRWCCGIDGNERWNTSQSAATWENDWLFMARRYQANKRVVGADLYNEVRRNILDDPNWGWGNDTDWQLAAQRAGDRILTEANPDLLIVVEGINWQGIPLDGLPHGRPTLEPAKTLSHTLVNARKLVYSAHFYGYTGPNHTGATGTGETHDWRYQELSLTELQATLDRQAFFVTTEGRHYTAPLWISEFGDGFGETDPKARAWFGNFVDYLIAKDTDFAVWPLVGWQRAGVPNSWSLVSWDPAGRRAGILDPGDWRTPIWNRLIGAPSRTGQVAPVADWSMLNLDHGDFNASSVMRSRPDWDVGARKGTCSDGERLIGLSHHDGRGLCTDAGGVVPSAPATVVWDERNVTYDWAGGYTKVQCPTGQMMVGYSLRGTAFASALCAPAPVGATASRTVWFDRGDNRPAGDPGGEFAAGNYKGQCATNEYAAGVAYTGRFGQPQKYPAALYCRSLA